MHCSLPIYPIFTPIVTWHVAVFFSSMFFSVSSFASPFFMGEWATGYRLRSLLPIDAWLSQFRSIGGQSGRNRRTLQKLHDSFLPIASVPIFSSKPGVLLSLPDRSTEATMPPFSPFRRSHHSTLLSLPMRRAARRSSTLPSPSQGSWWHRRAPLPPKEVRLWEEPTGGIRRAHLLLMEANGIEDIETLLSFLRQPLEPSSPFRVAKESGRVVSVSYPAPQRRGTSVDVRATSTSWL